MASERYPVPAAYPTYEPSAATQAGGRRSLYPLIDALFVAIALFFSLWMAWLLLRFGSRLSVMGVIYAVLFYGLVAYLVLPRIHQTLTWIYVPQYFIARTRTGDGVLGDPVNLALNGSAEDIHAAMQRAGWILADELTLRSSWGMVKAALTRSSYPAAPVSDLFLLGRRQEFAYQQEVDGNVSARHHVRFWKVPDGWILPGGEMVSWLAAGTYDRAVGFSLFTMQITHKIDADIDRERDYIISSLRYEDPVISAHVIEDFSTSYHSHNGGGDAIRTDGDLPVVDVTGAAQRFEGFVAPKDPYEAGRTPADRHVPPASLLISTILWGLSVLVFAVTGILTWLGVGHAWFWGENLASSDRLLGGAVLVGLAIVGGLVAVRTLLHGRLARLIFMAAASLGALMAVDTISQMGSRTVRFMDVAIAMTSVLILLGLTSPAARRWVHATDE